MIRERQRSTTILVWLAWLALALFLWKAVDNLPDRDNWRLFQYQGAYKAMLAFAAFFILALALRSIRFGVLARQSAPVPWPGIILAFPWIFMIGAITPFRLGESYRAIWIRKHGGTSSRMIGYLFGERFSDLVILCTLLLVGLVSAPVVGASSETDVVYLFLFLAVAGYALLWLASLNAGRIERMLHGRAHFAVDLLGAFSYMRQPRLHLATIALSVSIWAAMAAAFYSALLLMDVSPAVGLAGALCCLGAVNLAGLLSAVPGNVGSFQAAMVASLIMFNVPAVDALVASVVLQVAGLTTTFALGFLARALETAWPGNDAPANIVAPRTSPNKCNPKSFGS